MSYPSAARDCGHCGQSGFVRRGRNVRIVRARFSCSPNPLNFLLLAGAEVGRKVLEGPVERLAFGVGLFARVVLVRDVAPVELLADMADVHGAHGRSVAAQDDVSAEVVQSLGEGGAEQAEGPGGLLPRLPELGLAFEV